MNLNQYRLLFLALSAGLLSIVFIDAGLSWFRGGISHSTFLPIGYFTLIKISVCAYAAISLIKARVIDDCSITKAEEIGLVLLLLLFQPIFDISLSKEAWLTIDILALTMFAYLEREIWWEKFKRYWGNPNRRATVSRNLKLASIVIASVSFCILLMAWTLYSITNSVAKDAQRASFVHVAIYCKKILSSKQFLTSEEKKILEKAEAWSEFENRYDLIPDNSRESYPFDGSIMQYSLGSIDFAINRQIKAFEYSSPRKLYPNLCSHSRPKWKERENLIPLLPGDVISHGYYLASDFKTPDYFYGMMRRNYGLPNMFGIVEWTFWNTLLSNEEGQYRTPNLNLWANHK